MVTVSAPGPYELLVQGRDLLAARRSNEAVEVLQVARELEPEKGSVREALGRALYNSGDPARATKEFQAAVDLNPADDYAYFGLALCTARLGNRQRAAGLLKLALAMKPDSESYQRALDRLAW